jgi:hypothetical protein
MNYDTMSVHDLIGEAMYIGAEHLMVMKDLIPAFECAFRAAVIREASVGTVTFTKDGENSVIAFDGITHLEKISDTYFGIYRLIPKETP